MESLTPVVWFPVVTLVLGLALKAAFDFLNEKRAEEREKKIRLEKRKELIQQQRVENQRKLLMEIQEVLAKLMRSVSLQHLEDVANYRASGKWAKEDISEEVSLGVMEGFRRANLLRVRVFDDHLRQQISDLTSRCTKVTRAESERESELAWMESGYFFNDVNERLGEILRAYEKSELAHLAD